MTRTPTALFDGQTAWMSTDKDENGNIIQRKQEPEPAPIKPWHQPSEGDVLVHKVFGKGTVSGLDLQKNYLHVAFADGDKTFVYPEAFEKGYVEFE